MKNKKERAQALSDALDQLDDAMLQNAYEVDDAEKFRALGRSKAVKPEKTRTVTRFHLYTAVAACLVLAIGISLIVLENVPNFHLWGSDPLLNSVGTKPSTTPSTQPTNTIEPPTSTPTYPLNEYSFVQILADPAFTFDFSINNLLERVDYVFTAKVTDVSFEVIDNPGTAGGKVMITTFELEVDTQYRGQLPEKVYLRNGGGYPNSEYLEEQVAIGEAGGLFDGHKNIKYQNFIKFPDIGESYLFTLRENEMFEGYLTFDWPFACTYTIDEDQEIKNPSVPCYATIKNYFENQNSGTCGDDLTWTLDADGTLTISGTGAIDIYRNSNFVPWDADSVKKIIIGSGVTSIGYLVFRDHTNLTSVTISDSVTSIGEFAFANCTNLTNVTMGSGVTTIEQGAFIACNSLIHIAIPDSVTSIERNAFERCDNLWHVFYTGSEAQWEAIEIGENNKPLLEAVRHNNYTGEEITSAMKFPASGNESIVVYGCSVCEDAQPVTIPQVTHEHNDACGIACGTCGDDLTWTLDADGTLTISGTGPMTDIIYALWDGEVVKKIIIEPGVTSIGKCAFIDCGDLTNVLIPASVTSIGNSAFLWCDNLYHLLYTGSKTQWDTIEMGYGIADWRNLVLHYDCTGNEVVDADRRFCEICSAACTHAWGPGIRTQKPTCTEEGSIYYYCTLCNGTKTESIPKLPHTYDNDDDTTCNICGHDRGDSGFPIWIPIVAIVVIGGIVALIVLKKKR